MSWERFSYICRKVSCTLAEEETAGEGILRAEREPGIELYGDRVHAHSLPRQLLTLMAHTKSREQTLAAMAIYSKMAIPQQLAEPMQFKRVTAYLSYVVFIFFIVSGVYQLKVAPQFIETFSEFGFSAPSQLLFYREFGWIVSLLIFIMLFAGLVVSFALRRLFKFRLGQENSVIIRFLAFKGIRGAYLNVVTAMAFPSSDTFLNLHPPRNEVERHLSGLAGDKLCLAHEIHEIIKVQMQLLIQRCEMQMKLISVLIAVVVVSAIFFFLVSAYSPLFILGDTL